MQVSASRLTFISRGAPGITFASNWLVFSISETKPLSTGCVLFETLFILRSVTEQRA